MPNERINYLTVESHLVSTANALPLKRLLLTVPQLLLLPQLVSNNFIAMKLSFIVLAPAGGVGGLEFLCGSEVFIFPQVMAFPIFPWIRKTFGNLRASDIYEKRCLGFFLANQEQISSKKLSGPDCSQSKFGLSVKDQLRKHVTEFLTSP